MSAKASSNEYLRWKCPEMWQIKKLWFVLSLGWFLFSYICKPELQKVLQLVFYLTPQQNPFNIGGISPPPLKQKKKSLISGLISSFHFYFYPHASLALLHFELYDVLLPLYLALLFSLLPVFSVNQRSILLSPKHIKQPLVEKVKPLSEKCWTYC